MRWELGGTHTPEAAPVPVPRVSSSVARRTGRPCPRLSDGGAGVGARITSAPGAQRSAAVRGAARCGTIAPVRLANVRRRTQLRHLFSRDKNFRDPVSEPLSNLQRRE